MRKGFLLFNVVFPGPRALSHKFIRFSINIKMMNYKEKPEYVKEHETMTHEEMWTIFNRSVGNSKNRFQECISLMNLS
jgi:hypothetical protein